MEDEFNINDFFEQIFSQMEEVNNINDIINFHDEEIKGIKDSFNITWENYNVVSRTRKEFIRNLLKLRIKIFLSFFFISLINNEMGLEVDRLIDKVKTSSLKIKDQKELLILIKKSLKELEKRMIPNCNYDINELLELLFNQDIVLVKILTDEIKLTQVRLNGINVQTATKNSDDLKQIEDKIDYYVKGLGLK